MQGIIHEVTHQDVFYIGDDGFDCTLAAKCFHFGQRDQYSEKDKEAAKKELPLFHEFGEWQVFYSISDVSIPKEELEYFLAVVIDQADEIMFHAIREEERDSWPNYAGEQESHYWD